MTCCIAARYDDGILLGTDSLITAGNTRLFLNEAKTFYWRGLLVAYAGPLSYIQQLEQRPTAGYKMYRVESFQRLVWDFPMPEDKEDDDADKRDDVEFLVVDNDLDMYIVSGHGDMVRVKEPYAVVGSEHGWLGMDLEYERLRTRTLSNTKRMIAKVLRVVARRDNTVDEPFYYVELT